MPQARGNASDTIKKLNDHDDAMAQGPNSGGLSSTVDCHKIGLQAKEVLKFKNCYMAAR
jgi:hypothetical protein